MKKRVKVNSTVNLLPVFVISVIPQILSDKIDMVISGVASGIIAVGSIFVAKSMYYLPLLI